MEELPITHPMRSPIMLRLELIAAGHNDRSIARAITNKDLHRIRHGSYVAYDAWHALSADGQHALRGRAVLARARTGMMLSHVSALPDWGAPTWGLDLSHVHVTRTDHKAGRKEAGIQQHRGRTGPLDVVRRNGIPLSAPARLLLEVATVSGLEPSLVVWNHFLHHDMTTLDAVAARYCEVSGEAKGSMEHWPATLVINLLMQLADPRIESVGESRTLHLCWRQHLPMPVPQLEVRDRSGRVVARLDFAWPEHRVWLEFDGMSKYGQHLRDGETAADAVIREKRREDLIRELTGWRCIRITWADLMHPEKTALRIRRLLGIDQPTF